MFKDRFPQIGRYKILEELGRGGMGVVYKAYDPVIDRTVALKMINFRNFAEASEIEELKIRLRQEVKVAGKLSHPNIITIYDVAEEEDIFCILMEYVDGESLAKILTKKKMLSLEESVLIVQKICNALDYAHKQGIIHRDIKPGNIMLTRDDVPKLMDFGIAKLVGTTVTKTSKVLGTPSYTAPEIIKGEKVDARADIFSLGCVFYEIITGERAFQGENITPIMYKILEEEPIPPVQFNKNLPSAINTIISKALAKNVSDRYQSIEDFARDLAALAAPVAVSGAKRKKRIPLESLILPLGVSFFGALIAILLILFIPQSFRTEVSSLEWAENTLFANDSKGKEVWKKSFDAEIGIGLINDINGDGKIEIVVGTYSKKHSKGAYGEVQGRIYLLDANGKEIWRVNAGVEKAYREFDDKYCVVSLRIENLNNDGYKDIIATTYKAPWYPNRLLILYGTKDLKIRQTLEYWNPGNISIGFIDDIDNDGNKDLVCWGGNNDMGSRSVIFALSSSLQGGQAPPWRGNMNLASGELWYVPLGSGDIVHSMKKLDNGTITVFTNHGEIFLDFYGNILEGPNSLPLKERQSRVILRRKIYETWRVAFEFVRNNNYELAIKNFKEAIKLAAKSDNPYLLAILHIELAYIYEILKQYNDSIYEFKKALELDPDCYVPYQQLGELYEMVERYQDAIEIYIKGIGIFINNWQGEWLYRSLIQSCILAGDIDRLKDLCGRHTMFRVNSFVAFSAAGDGYIHLGEFNKAISIYRELLVADSVNAYDFVFEGLTRAYAYLDTNLNEAEDMILKAIKENPKFDSSLAGVLGWIYFKQAKFGKKHYDSAFNEVNKAIAYYSNSNHPIQLYRPTLAELYFFLANIAEAMGEPENAKRHYQTSLKLNRGDTYIKRASVGALELIKKK